jgi:hypothetical protein
MCHFWWQSSGSFDLDHVRRPSHPAPLGMAFTAAPQRARETVMAIEAAVLPLLGCLGGFRGTSRSSRMFPAATDYADFLCGKSSNARRATICKSPNVVRPLPAHPISRSAMYFRSLWRPPCGSSRHTSSSTTSMSVWVRWLRSLSRKFLRWGIAALHGHAGGSATLSATDAYGTKPSRWYLKAALCREGPQVNSGLSRMHVRIVRTIARPSALPRIATKSSDREFVVALTWDNRQIALRIDRYQCRELRRP